MESDVCPNLANCNLVNDNDFEISEEDRLFFITNYCKHIDAFNNCRRYETKKSLGFCSDFVLPNSDYTIDEILDKLEEQ